MKLGVQVPNFTMPGGPAQLGPRLVDIARAAEDAGFASFWVMDHFFQIGALGSPEMEMVEGYTVLSYVAAVTKRMRLGTMVTGVAYRHPGILAKIVTALDVLSGGRANLGIGAAWNEQEHRGLGVPFPPVKQRFERLEEALQIVLQMWSTEVKPFHGKHYQLAETLNSPQALSKPHPPILIGGGGERKTLRLVAKYADACNLFASAEIPRKLKVLREHCREVGRNYNAIEKTSLGTLDVTASGSAESMTPSRVVEMLGGLSELGIQHAIFNMPRVWELATFELIGREIIPQASKL